MKPRTIALLAAAAVGAWLVTRARQAAALPPGASAPGTPGGLPPQPAPAGWENPLAEPAPPPSPNVYATYPQLPIRTDFTPAELTEQHREELREAIRQVQQLPPPEGYAFLPWGELAQA